MVTHLKSGTFYLIQDNRIRPWSFESYRAAVPCDGVAGPFIVLTPMSTVKALAQGYRPELHPSAL
jgi:hypothetical protein